MSFAARALRARAANDTTRAQINNIPEKSHVIPLLTWRDLELSFNSIAGKMYVMIILVMHIVIS